MSHFSPPRHCSVYSQSFYRHIIFIACRDVFQKHYQIACNILQKTGKQRSSALCLQAKGVMLDFWNEATENQLALQHRSIKMQNRETRIRFILPCLNFGQHCSKQGEKNEPPRPQPPILNLKGKKKKKCQRLYLFQMTEFKWTHSATENVFSLNCLRQRGRNKHALHASFCYSSLFCFESGASLEEFYICVTVHMYSKDNTHI